MSKKNAAKVGVIGVIVGAIGGLLFAPKSGKETRQDIKSAAAKANQEAEAKLKELHKELKKLLDESSKELTKLKGKAADELNDLIKRAEFTKDKVSELITAVRDFEADDGEVEKTLKDGKSLVAKLDKSTKPKSRSSKSSK